MFNFHQSWAVPIVVCLPLAAAACRPKPPERIVENRSETAPALERGVKEAASQKQKAPEPPPRPTIPKVALSGALGAACVVGVNEQMPEAKLPDAANNLHGLSSLYGPKLTVVCLWTIGDTPRSRLVATQALRDLMKDVVEPFGEKGVRVVAINVGDTVESAQQHVAQAGATFPNLSDPEGDYFAKLAKDRQMPRTYLLDAGGRILWFDVEYSRSSRRDLVQGIRVALGEL